MPKDGALTGISRRRVSKLISISRRQSHTDVPTRQGPASSERQFFLDRVIRLVAPMDNVEVRTRVAALRHEQLGCVVGYGVLNLVGQLNAFSLIKAENKPRH